MLRARSSMSRGSTYWVSMKPADRLDEPAADSVASSRVTSVTPRSMRCQAVESPTAPPPMIATEVVTETP